MCLTCKYSTQTVQQKEELFKNTRVYLHTHSNQIIQLTSEQIKEITEHALYVLCTGVDCNTDIWAIQWNREYKVQTIP